MKTKTKLSTSVVVLETWRFPFCMFHILLQVCHARVGSSLLLPCLGFDLVSNSQSWLGLAVDTLWSQS